MTKESFPTSETLNKKYHKIAAGIATMALLLSGCGERVSGQDAQQSVAEQQSAATVSETISAEPVDPEDNEPVATNQESDKSSVHINTDPSQGPIWNADTNSVNFCYKDPYDRPGGDGEISISYRKSNGFSEIMINNDKGNACEGKDRAEGIPANGYICVNIKEGEEVKSDIYEMDKNQQRSMVIAFKTIGSDTDDEFLFPETTVWDTSLRGGSCESYREWDETINKEYYQKSNK